MHKGTTAQATMLRLYCQVITRCNRIRKTGGPSLAYVYCRLGRELISALDSDTAHSRSKTIAVYLPTRTHGISSYSAAAARPAAAGSVFGMREAAQ